MKHILQLTNSILEFSPTSTDNHCSKSTPQSRNHSTEVSQNRCQITQNSYSGSSQNGWDSVTQLDPEREWYHLPRSSPVILRRAHCQEEEDIGQSLERPTSCLLYSTPPAQNTSATPDRKQFLGSLSLLKLPEKQQSTFSSLKTAQRFLQNLPLALHCISEDQVKQTVKLCGSGEVGEATDRDKQANPLQNSLCHTNKPRAWSLSEGLYQPLNDGPHSDKARADSDTDLILGSVNEEQIAGDFYRKSMDIDQENAHFVVVDMVLEVVEALKWAADQQQLNTTDLPMDKNTYLGSKTHSVSSLDSGYDDNSGHRFSSNRNSQTAFHSSQKVPSCSAEDLACQLLSEFKKTLPPSEWLFSCCNQYESLEKQQFPIDTISVVMEDEISLTEEIRQRSRMRGALNWAPPRFQIIFTVQPTQRRSDVIASQHYLCAGCGTEIERRYIKRLRYCDYLGRYFCNSCHGGGESMIPGRVLSRWDFSRYPVCIFSKQLLDTIWEQPLFKLTSMAKELYGQAKELQKFRELQEQMISIKKLLRACRLSDGVLAEFQQLPSHLTDEPHRFSMDDLVRIKRGQLINMAKTMLRTATNHVESCELCQAKGFICEFCHGQEVLFPFQTDICTRCPDCRACFHTVCFRGDPCPKCDRLQSRKSLQDA
ncbi:protein associated with UVRAG as autophagy enhancer [Brachyhypopomus gauderio]|uniref:protein associated with UVRAG as autophagy enhancer n=1 Tax=Brachyhypopomus gauderio TaxID=698409 RepID=UPI004040FB44